MSDTKWTPGPWRITGLSAAKEGEIVGPNHKSDDACDFIAFTFGGLDESENNAHLIVAAPDLYDALAGCVKWLEESPDGERATQLALAALKKARGES